ncbi:TrkH family potassium uptake protein [Desulforamulus aeronauticus]|uniref:Trk system potassium uptake protein TrkH n=1 Tax=Desulforamulus aeronauticus DSM 10349 TaxID=1121421 RepID=A0A1M6WU10_9FIRM|nr:TrkH family potassium uptake protein [Desulforamulus aeronauticus]SHK97262.1 trk system potassium uptake protein TrkH [Desulforamulus aeronauticus DSM 10349]
MNTYLILRALGIMLCCEAVAMLPSFGLSLVEEGSDDTLAFFTSITITAIIGLALTLSKPRTMQVGYKEGFIVATSGWLLLSIFGAIPYFLSGIIPLPVDAFFESASGFTTTGASMITDVETLPRGILFWRSLTNWLGGMGIIVLTLAIMPSLNVAGFRMFKAEVPGPTKSKVLPKVAQTAKELYKVYLCFSLVELLLLKTAGMSWFDSLIHALGTVATGGFSSKNTNISYYDSLSIELIIVFFMILCGINFSLHYSVSKGNWLAYFKDTETKTYLAIVAVAVMFVSINLVNDLDYSVDKAARLALFQVASVITSTGFITEDFYQWPDLSRYLLFTLMLIGACSGSTGGGIKVIRLIILMKAISNQLARLVHPQAVIPVRLGNNVIPQEVVQTVQNFFALFVVIIGFATGLLVAMGLDLATAATTVVTSISCLGTVSPSTVFVDLPAAAKLILTFCMFIGRLELFTVLVVLNMCFSNKR